MLTLGHYKPKPHDIERINVSVLLLRKKHTVLLLRLRCALTNRLRCVPKGQIAFFLSCLQRNFYSSSTVMYSHDSISRSFIYITGWSSE